MSLIVDNITKFYGQQKALNAVSFSVNEGEICGFLGPNGAGKSTMMKIITGCLDRYEGEISICNINTRKQPLKAKALTGYLPEHNPLYTDMYIKEYLIHIGKLYNVGNIREQVENVIEITGLAPEKKKKIGQLSKGYRQRVGLAQALIHDPEVLILDEPMTGLDPNQLEEIRELIIRIGKNKTVMLSTHIMQEVEAICDRIIIINKGEIVADKYKHELHSESVGRMSVNVQFSRNNNMEWLYQLSGIESVTTVSKNTFRIIPVKGNDPRIELFNAAALNHNPIIGLTIEEKNLEEIFKELTISSKK